MRIVIWSFSIFLCALLPLLSLFDPTWVIPKEYALAPTFAIIVLSIILQLEATGFLKLKALVSKLTKEKEIFESEAKEKRTSLLSKVQSLETSLDKERNFKKTLNQKEKKLTLDLEKYKTAQKDSQRKLEDLEKILEKKEGSEQALTLLSLLQGKGRLLDFLMDDITSYENDQVGTAARIVHDGCRKVLKEYFDIVPLVDSEEGSVITLKGEESSLSYKLIGKTFDKSTSKSGTILHRGWQTKTINLPESFLEKNETTTNNIISPAEVEIN